MTKAVLSEQDFMALYEKHGPDRMAKLLKVSTRGIRRRRRNLETKLHVQISGPNSIPRLAPAARLDMTVQDGVVLVGSDAHYWPGIISTAHRAFIAACRKLKPSLVIMNGDIMDGSSISRFQSIGWENKPTVAQEIETCKERLQEIIDASPKAPHIWPLGNHDQRLETRLATLVPEYAKVHGVHLKDHFPEWQPCWSVWLNDAVVIKHRFKGGVHAPYNNTIWSGKTIITGHLHALNVTAISDYNGTRWGVDGGTMADPYGPQFIDYTEDNPKNWRSGFVVLSFRDGKLLWPELVYVIDPEHVGFRGQVWEM